MLHPTSQAHYNCAQTPETVNIVFHVVRICSNNGSVLHVLLICVRPERHIKFEFEFESRFDQQRLRDREHTHTHTHKHTNTHTHTHTL